MEFYTCNHCGNIIVKLTDSKVPVMCCGQPMVKMEVGAKEAATEKHKPVIVERDGKKFATVGEVEHPMTEEHFIEWIVVDYGTHYRVHHLKAGDEPTVKLCGHCEVVDIYAYCNLHGLWKMDK